MPDQSQVTTFLIKCAWVLGGFVAGYVLTWLAAASFDRIVVKRKSSETMHKWARRIGGVVVALVVGFLLFPGGPGTGTGGEGGKKESGGETTTTTPATQPTPPTPPKTKMLTPGAMNVTIFAGDAVEPGSGNFFTIDGETRKVNVEGVMAELTERQKQTPKVQVVYTFDRTATDSAAGFIQLKKRLGEVRKKLYTPEEFNEAFGGGKE